MVIWRIFSTKGKHLGNIWETFGKQFSEIQTHFKSFQFATKIRKRRGPTTVPCGIPHNIEKMLRIFCNLCSTVFTKINNFYSPLGIKMTKKYLYLPDKALISFNYDKVVIYLTKRNKREIVSIALLKALRFRSI